MKARHSHKEDGRDAKRNAIKEENIENRGRVIKHRRRRRRSNNKHDIEKAEKKQQRAGGLKNKLDKMGKSNRMTEQLRLCLENQLYEI